LLFTQEVLFPLVQNTTEQTGKRPGRNTDPDLPKAKPGDENGPAVCLLQNPASASFLSARATWICAHSTGSP